MKAAFVLTLFASVAFGAAVHASPPNVLFIAVDDLRPELHCYGVARMETPHIDRLADRGLRFDRAYCNIAVCGASRASIMSGLRPTPTRFTGADTWVEKDAPNVPTLAATFRQAGYHTVTNGKVYHHRGDNAEAWSERDWRPPGGGLWWALPTSRALNTRENRGPAYESADKADEVYPDYKTASKTISDLARLAGQEKPFFIACGFCKPHLPFVAPERYWDLYAERDVELPDNMYFPRGLHKSFSYQWGELRKYHAIPKMGPLADDAARRMRHGYYSCVSFIDAQVGRLLDEVDRLGVADNTIIVLWGDHGWQLGEHGFWCKHTNFEVATRVPLIIVAPGHERGRSTNRLVEYVDVYPTLCDLAGLPKPDHLQGKSMLPLLEDVEADHKEAVFTRYGGGDAIRTEHYRYIEMRANRGRGKLRGRALFDLEKDPQENQNVAEDSAYAEVVKRLSARLTRARSVAVSKNLDLQQNEP